MLTEQQDQRLTVLLNLYDRVRRDQDRHVAGHTRLFWPWEFTRWRSERKAYRFFVELLTELILELSSEILSAKRGGRRGGESETSPEASGVGGDADLRRTGEGDGEAAPGGAAHIN